MKRHIVIIGAIFIFSLYTSLTIAQTTTSLTGLLKNESIAPVPDAPAFNALGSQPSNILRPSDTKALAVDIAPFIQGGKFTIPKDFALEISPGAFIYRDRRINIDDYRNKQIFLAYNTTISVGTGLDSANGLSKVAIGWRTTFINDADKFLDNAHRTRINNILMPGTATFTTSWQAFKIAHSSEFKSPSIMSGGAVDPLLRDALPFNNTLLQGPDSTLAKQFYADYQKQSNVQALVNAADKDFEKTHWNARRLDVAAAFVAAADSASPGNLKASQIKAWLTFCSPIQQHGQLVLGVYGAAGFEGVKKDTAGHIIHRPNIELTGSMRIYAGTSKYKFFAEAQAGIRQDEHIALVKPLKTEAISGLYPTSNFAIGTEIGIFNLAWVSLYGGIKDAGVKMAGQKSSGAYLRFDWKLTIPDWVKFRNE